jgi:sialate O-acetylesterase
MKITPYQVLILLLLNISYTVNSQTLILSKIFSKGMVLQRETEAPIWGTAPTGTTITVTGSWNNTPVQTVADSKGKFIAYLPTPAAGGPYTLTVNDITIPEVLIGEVWFCSGQSNMNLPLGTSYATTYKNANIRFFRTNVVNSNLPLDTLGGKWAHGDSINEMSPVSTVGYFFAQRLLSSLNVPIGMIGAYQGGTNAEEWINPSIFASLPANVKSAYTPPTSARIPGCLYNGMINPLLPYKISGMIWYQGENNASRFQTYSPIMKALVKGWRSDFKNDMLPFYAVQLPGFQSSNWCDFREIQQEIAESLPNSGFATTIDVGEETNIHPWNKIPVGNRLGDIALAKVYGKPSTFSSPIYKSALVEGKTLRIFFNFADKGLKINSGESPQLFEIAGADDVYYPAKARIEGNTVLVWAEEVIAPVKARYYWKNYAVPNLYSTDNFPVAPFRMK